MLPIVPSAISIGRLMFSIRALERDSLSHLWCPPERLPASWGQQPASRDSVMPKVTKERRREDHSEGPSAGKGVFAKFGERHAMGIKLCMHS